MRRTRPESSDAASGPEQYRFGDVTADFKNHSLQKNGRAVEVTPRELRLLRYLITHRGEVVGRDQLLDAVWDYDNPPLTRTVDMHVAKLRRKVPKFALLISRDATYATDVERDVVSETFDVLRSLGHSEADARRLVDGALASKKKFKDVESLIQAIYQQSHGTKDAAE